MLYQLSYSRLVQGAKQFQLDHLHCEKGRFKMNSDTEHKYPKAAWFFSQKKGRRTSGQTCWLCPLQDLQWNTFHIRKTCTNFVFSLVVQNTPRTSSGQTCWLCPSCFAGFAVEHFSLQENVCALCFLGGCAKHPLWDSNPQSSD